MDIETCHPLERAILMALTSVEPSDFHEFCRGLKGYCPKQNPDCSKSDNRIFNLNSQLNKGRR